MISLYDNLFGQPKPEYRLRIQVVDNKRETMNMNVIYQNKEEFIDMLERFNLRELAGFGRDKFE